MNNIENPNVQEDQFYDYRISQFRKKKTFTLNIAVVTTGMAVAMSTLYTGASLAQMLTYKDAVLSIVIGCAILGFVATLTGGIGADKGYPFQC